MSATTWGDLGGVGELELDVEMAVRHLVWTFAEDDIVHLVNLRPKAKGVKTTVISMGAELHEMIDALREQFDQICVEPWSTYYQLAPATEVVEGTGVRPDKTVCAGTRVLFADLDVGKNGGFASESEVQYFIDELAVTPGSVVRTGTGGAHLTWRLDIEDAERLRGELTGRQIGERWWTWLDSECRRLGLDHVRIDRLIDLDARVLRLPGSIRFPKYAGDVTAPVTAEYLTEEEIGYDKFYELTDATYVPYQKRISERRAQDDLLLTDMVDISGRKGKWSDLIIMSMIDELADEYLDWDDILGVSGWNKFRQGGDGSWEWQRPGGAGKSATTDWPESPGVMSLFSTDPSTGLLDLYEAEIPLTKWRVFLRLVHEDDVYAALDDLGLRAKG